MKKYKLLPEHEAQFKPWADKWIANAMSTKAMDSEDKRIAVEAIEGLYRAAGLIPPPRERIVFVPSPFVAAFASGFAAGWWWLKKNNKINASFATNSATNRATANATRNATNSATENATESATNSATYSATESATNSATESATENATNSATANATDSATESATYNATNSATENATDIATNSATRIATENATVNATASPTAIATANATRNATDIATENATANATAIATANATRNATANATDIATRNATANATNRATDRATRNATDKTKWYVMNGNPVDIASTFGPKNFLVECASKSWNMRNGGNQWSGWVSFLSFFRHVVKLDIDYSKYDSYEKAAIHSGPRYMHPEFCIISDRPEVLLVDDQNRPHCDDGPFCKWRDGSMLFSVHGVNVPAWIILNPETITLETVQKEDNQEIRRIMVEKMGRHKFINAIGGTKAVVDEDSCKKNGQRALYRYKDMAFLEVADPSTGRIYYLDVPAEAKTCQEANAFLENDTIDEPKGNLIART